MVYWVSLWFRIAILSTFLASPPTSTPERRLDVEVDPIDRVLVGTRLRCPKLPLVDEQRGLKLGLEQVNDDRWYF